MTMAYIIKLNPSLLADSFNNPSLWNAVYLATILSATVGTFFMAFFANKPFALAPGIGLSSYFAVVIPSIIAATGVSDIDAFHGGLAIVLISGILFVVLTLLKVRAKILDAIPKPIRLGITAGIGFMLIHIGLTSNAPIFYGDGLSLTIMDFFTMGASQTKAVMGGDYKMMILSIATLFTGLFVTSAFSHRKVKGSILLGILYASIVYWTGSILLNENPFTSLKGASFVPPFADMFRLTFFKFNFKVLVDMGLLSAIMTIITFCIVDMFDTIGTLLGTAKKAGMLKADDTMEHMDQALLADSLATCVGACTGTSTITTFVESAAGIEEGGKTGLTSFVTGLCFLTCMFLAPIAALIPRPATSAALFFAGALMLGSLKEIDYSDISSSIPIVLLLIFMMATSGIGTGIGIGLISYCLIKIFSGKWEDISILTVVLSLLFLVKFFMTF